MSTTLVSAGTISATTGFVGSGAGLTNQSVLRTNILPDVANAGTITTNGVDGNMTSGTSFLTVAKGGIGATSLSNAYSPIVGNGTGALAVSALGASGTVLLSNGASVNPSFRAIPYLTQAATQTFTVGTSTYTPTANTKYCVVEIVGGGGGGGAANAAAGAQGLGGGGGAGAYGKCVFAVGDLPATKQVVVGAGGAGGTGSSGGSAGGASTFGSPAVITMGGGSGGAGTGSSTHYLVKFGGAGGTSSVPSGQFVCSGGTGKPGCSIFVTAGSNYALWGGSGGSTPLGKGGDGASDVSKAGQDGLGYGSGGGGGAGAPAAGHSGGKGADGICYITDFV